MQERKGEWVSWIAPETGPHSSLLVDLFFNILTSLPPEFSQALSILTPIKKWDQELLISNTLISSLIFHFLFDQIGI